MSTQPFIPLRARQRLQYTKYRTVTEVAIPLNATELDIQIDTSIGADTSILLKVAPMVTLNNNIIPFAIALLPGQSDFRRGFRLLLGAPAPAGTTVNYSLPIGKREVGL